MIIKTAADYILKKFKKKGAPFSNIPDKLNKGFTGQVNRPDKKMPESLSGGRDSLRR